MQKIYLIIPVYNEAANIEKLLANLGRLIDREYFRIIFIDDGSTDDTLKLLCSQNSFANLEIIRHQKNLGIAQTFYDGLYAAVSKADSGDTIIIMEGDNTSDVSLIPQMSNFIAEGKDIVIASRYCRGGGSKNFPWRRSWGSKVVNRLLQMFFYLPQVTDYSIFYRAYRAELIWQALMKLGPALMTTNSFAANLELLLKLQQFKPQVVEVPFVYDYGLKQGSSKMKLWATLWEYRLLFIKRLFGRI